jgi:hypothetical protein
MLRWAVKVQVKSNWTLCKRVVGLILSRRKTPETSVSECGLNTGRAVSKLVVVDVLLVGLMTIASRVCVYQVGATRDFANEVLLR